MLRMLEFLSLNLPGTLVVEYACGNQPEQQPRQPVAPLRRQEKKAKCDNDVEVAKDYQVGEFL